jgi:hypothetical protein
MELFPSLCRFVFLPEPFSYILKHYKIQSINTSGSSAENSPFTSINSSRKLADS